MSANTEYQKELDGLAGAVGSRNSRLLRIANLGILAGYNSEAVVDEIIAASGSPVLGEGEVRRAVEKAASSIKPGTNGTPYRPGQMHATSRPSAPPPGWERGAPKFVRTMCEAGREVDRKALIASSPQPVPSLPEEQTATFLLRLYAPEEYVFIGEQYTHARIGESLRTRDDWLEASRSMTMAPQIIANPLTGLEGKTQEGKLSLRCLDCIAAFRYALIEFDAMPLEDQLAFWAGVINQNALPVASIVFSGKKSLHGLVRLDARDATHWGECWKTLDGILCPAEVPAQFRADAACKDATRQTRLPGALRSDTGTLQSLLWLA